MERIDKSIEMRRRHERLIAEHDQDRLGGFRQRLNSNPHGRANAFLPLLIDDDLNWNSSQHLPNFLGLCAKHHMHRVRLRLKRNVYEVANEWLALKCKKLLGRTVSR